MNLTYQVNLFLFFPCVTAENKKSFNSLSISLPLSLMHVYICIDAFAGGGHRHALGAPRWHTHTHKHIHAYTHNYIRICMPSQAGAAGTHGGLPADTALRWSIEGWDRSKRRDVVVPEVRHIFSKNKKPEYSDFIE
jgi:hypothetical protein